MNNEYLRVKRGITSYFKGPINNGSRTFLEKGNINISDILEQVLDMSSHRLILS